ncbi:hypothetical protein M2168_004268 [Streptomyces sp. CZ24]|uniref:hypothetical protein n=1 Tax=Streptomyces albidoflavus TaxID=1886 RepID=UPI0004CBEA08|nr:hypothetical protein [Streptomyces sp. CZ24]
MPFLRPTVSATATAALAAGTLSVSAQPDALRAAPDFVTLIVAVQEGRTAAAPRSPGDRRRGRLPEFAPVLISRISLITHYVG